MGVYFWWNTSTSESESIMMINDNVIGGYVDEDYVTMKNGFSAILDSTRIMLDKY